MCPPPEEWTALTGETRVDTGRRGHGLTQASHPKSGGQAETGQKSGYDGASGRAQVVA